MDESVLFLMKHCKTMLTLFAAIFLEIIVNVPTYRSRNYYQDICHLSIYLVYFSFSTFAIHFFFFFVFADHFLCLLSVKFPLLCPSVPIPFRNLKIHLNSEHFKRTLLYLFHFCIGELHLANEMSALQNLHLPSALLT